MLDSGMHEIPTPGVARLARMEASLKSADDWALLVDIDGTLLDMAPTPDAVNVPPGLVDTLARLKHRLGGALALITGRRIVDADRFFDPLKLVALGVHGAEARTDPAGSIAMLGDPLPASLLGAVQGIADGLPGIMVEDKGVGVAVHYRNAPEARLALELELQELMRHWDGFTIRQGRKVLEVVPKAHSKGTGLTWLMTLPTFQGRRPVMIGDDHGDEPALQAAERLGGIGLRVAGEHFCNGADLDRPASVRAWLSGWTAALEAGRRPST
jgi:trehalose 6-phosphate phosphatase